MQDKVSKYSRMMMQLLPPGDAWQPENHPLMAGLASSIERACQEAERLMVEIDPANSVALLERYERLCGLPDRCIPEAGLTLEERQERLDRIINIRGGINQQFYLDMLSMLGYEHANITPYTGQEEKDRPFQWTITLHGSRVQWRKMSCKSQCSQPLEWGKDPLVECSIEKLTPSHTKPIFVYQEE